MSLGPRIEIAVPVRYFPEASSASFTQSLGYGFRILHLLVRFLPHRWGIIRGRQFESLRARYRRFSPAPQPIQ